MGECKTVRLVEKTNIHHNEGSGKIVCNSPNPNPKTSKISIEVKKENGSTYVVAFNSWSDLPFWNSGYLKIDTKKWSMTGYLDGVFSDSEWLFCDPTSVIDNMIDGLKCYILDETIDEKDRIPVNQLLMGIAASRDKLIASAHMYTKAEDCKRNPTKERSMAEEPYGVYP